jgi:hypothetical protein
MKKNKPDYVVQNEETGKYDSFLKTYQTSISGPKIEVQDLTPFKRSSISKAHHKFEKRAEEIRKRMEDLVIEYQDNDLVWNSEMTFEPHVGTEIYLYRRNSGDLFCSMISPEEWGREDLKFEGSFVLTSEHIWKRQTR